MQLKPFLLDTESSWRVQRASLIFPSSGVCARGHGDFQSTASGHKQLFTNLMDCFHQSSNFTLSTSHQRHRQKSIFMVPQFIVN